MKKAVLLGVAFLFLTSLAFAEEDADKAASTVVTETAPAPETEPVPPVVTEPSAVPVDTEFALPAATESSAPVAPESIMAPAQEPFAPTANTEQPAAPAAMEQPTAETITMTGDIIDNMCAGMQTPETLPEFVKAHTKQCTLKPECVASGYAIFSDGKLYKFDKDSNAKIEEFLNKEDSKLQVSITAKKIGDELSLVSIDNQPSN